MRVYQRGRVWWFDGLVDGRRERFSLGSGIVSRAEAEKWLSKFSGNNDELALRNFIPAYLREIKIRLSARTIQSYKYALNLFESHFGLFRQLNTISARDVSAWSASLLESGLSPESVNVCLRSIKAAFNRAVIWELIIKAPRIEMVKTPKRLPRHLSVEQFKALIERESDENFKRLWVFMVWTALRRGEVLGLFWEHVSFEGKPQALITGKGDKQRVIPLLPPAVEAMGAPRPFGRVFPVGEGDYVSHRFLRVARAAGLQARLHDLRHTALTWMVAQGVPLKLVQDIAGHSDIKTTMGYAKTFSGGAYETLFKAFDF